MATLSFFGAAGTVTGSCSMLETDSGTFMVDCGMFQGNKTVRALNYQEFPFDPELAKFLLLTHAHIDHSGLLPKLVKAGFKGPIYATAPTVDLLEYMLLDSANIQESNAERANRRRQRRGQDKIEPIYEEQDARKTLKMLKPVEYGEWFEPVKGVHVRYWNAGHMLGSASIEVKFHDNETKNTMRLLFSGDLGPDEKVFHPEPGGEQGFDYIISESTYGDRNRDDYTLEKRREAIRKELVDGLARGGNVVIPCFAVERSQELLHDIGTLLANGDLPNTTVYLDSPLARKVTTVFIKYANTLDDIEIDEEMLFRDKNFKLVESVDESKAIKHDKRGCIIISASGMADAGRIQHHLKNNIWKKEATILFVGYQAPGTTGHLITSGEKEIRIHGQNFKVKATIRRLGNYSAHADQQELLEWIIERGPVVGGLFLNHGDDDARAELRRLVAKKGWDIDKIYMPHFDESFELSASSARSKGRAPQRMDESTLQRDWYNDYAAFLIELNNELENETNPEKRREMIAKLKTVIEGGK